MQGVSLAGVMNGVLKRVCDRTSAVIVKQLAPGINGAGYGHGVGGMLGNFTNTLALEPFRRRLARRPPGTVEGDNIAAAFWCIEDETIAADAR